MDEEIITWNLRGPKKMKKRRELNALLHNSTKYRPLITNRPRNSIISDRNGCINLLTTGDKDVTLRLSTEDEDQLYFSANKSVIRK
jgi:hypothetical protein